MSRSRLLVLGLLLALAPDGWAQDPVVRVRLFGGPLAAPELTAEDGDAWIADAEGQRVPLATGEDATVRAAGRELTVMGRRSSRFEVEGVVLRVQQGRTDRAYRGRLVLTAESGKVQLVNHVPLPDYVASVVASEYPFDEIEGVKAQAVLARTYALRRQGAFADYDLDDHQGSQVYKGVDVVTAVSERATRETTGLVLDYRGELAEAFYSSSSGGFTAANESIWSGAPLPYLRAVPDPYDSGAPDHRWTQTVAADAVHRALSARYGGRVTGFEVTRRGPSGRVVEMALQGGARRTITGSQFRSAVNASLGWRTIRSTQFTSRRVGADYVLDGQGFGHGVGMSQYGARGAARAGLTFEQILAHYFQGTSVVAFGRPAYAGAPVPRAPTGAPSASGSVPGGAAPAPTATVPRYVPPTARTRPTPRHVARAQEAEAGTPPRRKAW